MSGVIGHLTYAILGAKAATQRALPIAPLLSRHQQAGFAQTRASTGGVVP